MEEAHRKTIRPTRATKVNTGRARAAHGTKKVITWWDTSAQEDTPKTVPHRPKTNSHMALRTKTKSSMVAKPKYTRVSHKPKTKIESSIALRSKPPRVGLRTDHMSRPKTKMFMSVLESLMSIGSPINIIQQRGKTTPTTTLESSSNGVFRTIEKLSFLVQNSLLNLCKINYR